jgi:hypothetical protein
MKPAIDTDMNLDRDINTDTGINMDIDMDTDTGHAHEQIIAKMQVVLV